MIKWIAYWMNNGNNTQTNTIITNRDRPTTSFSLVLLPFWLNTRFYFSCTVLIYNHTLQKDSFVIFFLSSFCFCFFFLYSVCCILIIMMTSSFFSLDLSFSFYPCAHHFIFFYYWSFICVTMIICCIRGFQCALMVLNWKCILVFLNCGFPNECCCCC